MNLLILQNLIFFITIVNCFPSSHLGDLDFPPFEEYPLDDDNIFDNDESRIYSDASASANAETFGIKYQQKFDPSTFHGDNNFHRRQEGENSAASATAVAGVNLGGDKKSTTLTKSETISNSNEGFSSALATSIASSN
ncbi:uncharacterized protein LOC127283490 [Leptopilina boulardi]|uniref:uncharacterized protein LOC127283490 n=1 Tax=Leptopilina boulardi TaxID=63433 RepID=UPI0021F6990B|nr:uncharacterized protein LOC127283490 [Leptopilina boulardi]